MTIFYSQSWNAMLMMIILSLSSGTTSSLKFVNRNHNKYISQQIHTARNDHVHNTLRQIERSQQEVRNRPNNDRELQTTATDTPTTMQVPTCKGTTSVNFETTDTLNTNLFGTNIFGTTCTCVEGM
jgi:hypothetical protein